MKNLYESLVLPNAKAIVALFVSGGLALFGLAGIDGDMTVKEAMNAITTAIFTAVSVWITANKKK